MADPRLNSVHLDPPRRQEYRRAREALLGARGWQTLAAESEESSGRKPPEPHTLIQNAAPEATGSLHCWLQDRDCIYPLKVGLNTVGRSQDNDVVIDGAYVSRRHCVILVHASNVCELHDTASKNGTYLNGQRLAGPTRLSSGDEIRMCERQLRFVSKDDLPEPPDRTATQTE